MNPLARVAAMAAAVAHEAVAEWRRLEAPPPPPPKTEINCTGANVRDDWTPVHRAPAQARASLGFGLPSGKDSQ